MGKIRLIIHLAIIVAVALALSPAGGASLAQGQTGDRPPVVVLPKGHDKLDSKLDRMVRAQAQARARSPLPQGPVETAEEQARVIIEAEPGNESAVINKVEALGGKHETDYQNLVQALVPVSRLETLANEATVRHVRQPLKPMADATGQGVNLIHANDWQSGGINGTGTKVGILDLGFSGYSSLLGSELPATVTTWWAPSINGPGSEVHGTACAEIVYDIAPNAQFFLANFNTSVEFSNAVNWLISQGVNVISSSVGWFATGPGNGTGSINNVVATARNAGILWAQSAGNQARRHWSGTWQDTDSDNYHEFSLSPLDEGQTISLSAGQALDVYLTWNDPWGASGNNYDLLLFNSSNVMVDSSTDIQNGNDDPDEELSYPVTVSGDYYLAIRKTSATGTPFFRLLSYTHELQYQVAAGSLMEPADSLNSLAVGAVPWSSPTTLETFSSQGPTTDGRVKPDLVAPDGVSSVAYGHAFYGTSASAPHVAGAALLVKQRYPSYTPAQIQSFLEANAVDIGAGGKDNLYGSGRLSLPALQPVEVYFKLDTDPAAGNQGQATLSKRVNDTFTVQLFLELDIIQATGADAYVKFDNAYLEATSATANTVAGWTSIKLAEINNAGSDASRSTGWNNGYVKLSLGGTTLKSGAIEMGSITFRAKAGVASTAAGYLTIDPVQTKIGNPDLGQYHLNFVGFTAELQGAPVISINTPSSDVTITAGQTQAFVAQLDFGDPVAGADWKWDFDYHPGDTDVTATGITPLPYNWGNVAGTYVVRVTATNSSGTDSKTRTVTVQPGILDHVVPTPSPAFLQSAASQQFSASGFDQYNNPIPGLTYTWSVVDGGSINKDGLFTAGGTIGTFSGTVRAQASYSGATKQGTASVAIGASITVTATLQGDGRPEAGMNVPLTLKLYNQAVDTNNILILEPAATSASSAGGIAITNRNTTTKVITFTAGGLPTGPFNVTLHTPQSLVNLKTGVNIVQGLSIDMGTLLEGDAADINEDSKTIDIADFTRFATAYESVPSSPNWDERADFNRNGQVEVTDFAALYTNYGKTSPQALP